MAANPDSVFQSLGNDNAPLELLMIGSAPEDAMRCANALRNRGQTVRLESTETRDGLIRLLETEPADLVTINADAPTLPAAEAIEIVREANPSASIILLTENPPKWAEFAIEMGLRDLLHSISIGRLVFAIQREYQTLLLRQELSQTRASLENAEARFRKLLSSTRDAVAYIHEGMHIQSNPVYRELFGVSSEEMDDLTLMDLVPTEHRARLKQALKKARREEQTVQNLLFRRRTGDTFRADLELSPTAVSGETCVQVIIRTEGPEGELQARINELIDHDPQTRLLNRHAFIRTLETIHTEDGLPGDGLLIGINIDNFAALSENGDLDAADCLLEKTAEILREHFEENRLSRFGDHQFLGLARSDVPAEVWATRCLESLHQSTLKLQCNLAEEPEFTLGVLSINQAGELTIQELIRRCCRATRKTTKEKGSCTGSIRIFSEADLSTSEIQEAENEVVVLIDNALEHDGFRLLYQPIVSLEGDSRENYSIFVRLVDPTGIEHEPEWFQPHAGRAGRLAEIDRWVIRRAIRELAQHRAAGKKLNFHIALSREGAQDDSMLLWVCDCLREFRAKGGWLYFQFDLDLLEEQHPAVLKLTEGLCKINCNISCNAIPAEFADFGLLSRHHVRLARLSPELSGDLTMDTDLQDRLTTLNTELQNREIKTVATGVEDANTLATLWSIGVNYVQGHFLQEPDPSVDLQSD